MAHGLSGTRDASLEPYAKRFADAGFYVVLFDYRYLGASDGEPRQLDSIPRQLEDWKLPLPLPDPAGRRCRRIGLWGCSLSGGHVIVAAARDKRIPPYRRNVRCSTDTRSRARSASGGLGKIVRLAAHPSTIACARRSGCRRTTFRSSHPPANRRHADGRRVRRPESHRAAGLAQPGRRAYFLAVAVLPADPLRARSAMPGDAHRVRERSVASTGAATKAAALIGDSARLMTFPIGHFEIYRENGSSGEQRTTNLLPLGPSATKRDFLANIAGPNDLFVRTL